MINSLRKLCVIFRMEIHDDLIVCTHFARNLIPELWNRQDSRLHVRKLAMKPKHNFLRLDNFKINEALNLNNVKCHNMNIMLLEILGVFDVIFLIQDFKKVKFESLSQNLLVLFNWFYIRPAS